MDTRSQDTRTELIEAALYCFSEHGYDGTSIRMIAKRAGRPTSLIAHHFNGKEGLYLEVFRYLTSHSFAASDIEVPLSPDAFPRDRQEGIRLFRELFHSLYNNVCGVDHDWDNQRILGHRLFLSEMRKPRPEILEMLQKQFQPWMDGLKACMHAMRPDLRDTEIIFFGTAIMNQIAGQSLLEVLSSAIWGKHELSVFKGAELLIEFNLQGLGISQYSE